MIVLCQVIGLTQKEHVMQKSSQQKPDLKAVAAVAAKSSFVTPGMSFRPE
jgi:hypothetical protein